MVEHLIEGEWSVDQFRDEYYDYYLEEVPDDALSDEETELFGSIQEKLDWADPNPNKESRQYGWLDHHQYVQWVKRRMKNHERLGGT